MDSLTLALAAWIPVAGIVLALCIYPDDDCVGEQGHKEPVRSTHCPAPCSSSSQ